MSEERFRPFERAYESPMGIANRFSDDIPIDLEGMAYAMGIEVNMNAPLSASLSGQIRKVGSHRYVIDVNGEHSLNRRRFTLAHEIAHYLLHREMIGDGIFDNAMYRSGLSSEIESQANRLASELLMPARLMKVVFKAGAQSPSQLSKAFGTSEEAVRIRLRQLQLTPEHA